MSAQATQTDDNAVETSEASDADEIRQKLPDDVQAELTKAAFNPGTVRELIRDTYYMGPIGIGRGGWIGALNNGQPGTQLRRPNGALYNYPRSWRYTALERALRAGIIQHVGGGRFASTERGVAILRRIDHCPDCDETRVPMVKHSRYVGNPNTEGSIESHALVTQCPECGGTGYDYGAASAGYEDYVRDEEYVEKIVSEWLSDCPRTRTYGGPRDVDPDAAERVPETDAEEIESLLDAKVENHTAAEPREMLPPVDEGLYGRDVVTVDDEGEHYSFYGTDESIVASRTDEQGDVHIMDDGDGRLKVGMSYDLAVEKGLKDRLHYNAEDASWTGDYWTVDANRLARVVSKMTLGVTDGPQHEREGTIYPDGDEPMADSLEYLDVTVTEAAVEQVNTRMIGIDADGDLA